jgi:hypothetical protein
LKHITRRSILAAAPSVLAFVALPARAEKQYGPGVTDTEIKIGNTGPYSGPASSYGTIPKSMAAYYKAVNDQGGANGRKINFISYDDAYSPPKTVEQVRRLVEQDSMLLVATPRTPTNSAIWNYMNQRRCRSCLSPPAPPNGMTPNTILGRSVGSPITKAKGASTPPTQSSIGPTAKLGSSIRTTISERTI